MAQADIGIYGLGVMGANLALNFEDKGYTVALYNRTIPGKEEGVVSSFLEQSGRDKNFIGSPSEAVFVDSLKKPAKILLMVKAGDAVDAVLQKLIPLLGPDDIIIDGGNSHFEDSTRRSKKLGLKQLHFIGMGISGGEEGARHGPSLMPGGSPEAWAVCRPLLNRIAAKDPDGQPCCAWMGKEGAGHFVKMVHNGIEYADMQLIAEGYHFMKTGLQMQPEEIAATFEKWNTGLLGSFLLEITADILKVKDDDGSPLLEKVLDAAGQKGTGLWTSVEALQSGTPLPVITSAVNARIFSSYKALRTKLAKRSSSPDIVDFPNRDNITAGLEEALLAGRLIVLAEGFFLINQVSKHHGWNIETAEVARIWQNGCIIRSELLKPVWEALLKEPETQHLLESDRISALVDKTIGNLRNITAGCIKKSIPCPGMSNALTTYDSLQSGWLPANLIQAQRDYFGAHTYERTDRERGTFFHTEWSKKSD